VDLASLGTGPIHGQCHGYTKANTLAIKVSCYVTRRHYFHRFNTVVEYQEGSYLSLRYLTLPLGQAARISRCEAVRKGLEPVKSPLSCQQRVYWTQAHTWKLFHFCLFCLLLKNVFTRQLFPKSFSDIFFTQCLMA